jgi:hypothetical protein
MEEMGRKSKYDSTFKTKVVLDAMKESETLSDLAKKYEIAPQADHGMEKRVHGEIRHRLRVQGNGE